MIIRVVFSGRGYDQAQQLPAELELPDGATVDAAIDRLSDGLPADAPLPPACLLAVSGKHLGTIGKHSGQSLRDGDELLLVAPVAGG